MRFFSSKNLLLLLLAITSTVSMQATYEMNGDSCCRSSCYECSCEPLYCGSWGIQFDAGVRPIIWNGRKNFFSLQNANGGTGITTLANLPKYKSLYRVPWQVGGQISYAWGTNCNVFIEAHYAQAKRKHTYNAQLASSNLYISLSRYKLVDGYVGARYYTDRWCDRTSFFIGGKVGFIHHYNAQYISPLTGGCCCNFVGQPFFKSNTTIAGGLNVGIDICYRGNWSFVVTGEVIASHGPKGIGSVVLAASDSANLRGSKQHYYRQCKN